MEIFFFHLMPWPHIPEDFKSHYRSSWVVLPNSCYDPVAGHRIYREYLDQLAAADELGFDAVCVNEHHQNGYGTMPSPNVIAAILCERTKRAKIAILGNGICLRDNPLRVAEEVAMIDVISGGRVISGLRPRHRLRVLLARPRSHGLARALLRSARPDRESVDRTRTFRLGRRALPVPLRQRLAAAVTKTAPADLLPLAGLERDDRLGGGATLPVHLHVHADGADRPLLRPVPRRGLDEARLPTPARSASAGRRWSTWPTTRRRRRRRHARTSSISPSAAW